MTIRRSITLLVSTAALLVAACSSPTAPAKACAPDVPVQTNGNIC